jgi:ribosome recycling factor
VDYYGTPTPLNQVANLHVPEPSLITIQPWDVSQIGPIEKAIRVSDLGLNPANDGKIIRLPIPPLTEERRKELVKKLHGTAEHHRVSSATSAATATKRQEAAQGQEDHRGRRKAQPSTRSRS